jgi:hypothetical protein
MFAKVRALGPRVNLPAQTQLHRTPLFPAHVPASWVLVGGRRLHELEKVEQEDDEKILR